MPSHNAYLMGRATGSFAAPGWPAVWWRCFVALTAVCAAESKAKRVLVVPFFRKRRAAISPLISVAFETELVEKMGERVDLDEVSLDMARYADPNLQEGPRRVPPKTAGTLATGLSSANRVTPRVSSWSNTGTACFQKHPSFTPEWIAGAYLPMRWRETPLSSVKNFDGPGFIEDILQIAPATKNIAIVIGASAVEQYWGSRISQGV